MILFQHIDHGFHAVLIYKTYTEHLGLHKKLLPQPESVELAIKLQGKKVIIKMKEYMKLGLSDPSNCSTAQTVCTIMMPGLCMPIILVLPLLSYNEIIVNVREHTALPNNQTLTC